MPSSKRCAHALRVLALRQTLMRFRARAQVAWLNTVVRQLWPCVDKAAGDIVHAKLRDVLGGLSLSKYGISKVELTHFSLGPPPKLAGVKVWCVGGAVAVLAHGALEAQGPDALSAAGTTTRTAATPWSWTSTCAWRGRSRTR